MLEQTRKSSCPNGLCWRHTHETMVQAKEPKEVNPDRPEGCDVAGGLSTEEMGVLRAFERALQEKIEQSVLDAVDKMMKE